MAAVPRSKLTANVTVTTSRIAKLGEPPLSRTFSTTQEDENKEKWDQWKKSLISTDDTSIKLKTRGGITLRKRREAAKASASPSSQERLLDGAGPGQFPPLRFSDEETERLLAEAYAGIPKRDGKRGTRSFKRQKVRHFGIRKARSIKKAEKLAHHFDKMDKRSKRMQDILKVKEMANEVRTAEDEYQRGVLRKWAEMKGMDVGTSSVEGDENTSISDKQEI